MREQKRRCEISSENRVLGAPLVIDLANGLQLVLFCRDSVDDFPAVILWFGKFGRDERRRSAVLRRIDAIIGEGRSQRDLPSCITSRRGKTRPITGQHRCGWNVPGNHVPVRASSRSLVAAEEEEPVLHDGATDCSSKLIALQRVTFLSKKVPGVELIVAYELKNSVDFLNCRCGLWSFELIGRVQL